MWCLNRHVVALLHRNFIYRKRCWFGSLIELMLPSAAILLLVVIKVSLEDTDSFKPKTIDANFPTQDDALVPLSFGDYITVVRAPKVCIPNPYDFLDHNMTTQEVRQLRHQKSLVKGLELFISGIDVLNWPIPFVKCDARKCREAFDNATTFCSYNVLAVAPQNEDSSASSHVYSFMDYLTTTYLDLPLIETQIGYPLIQKFRNSADIDSYVTDKTYGQTNKPKIAVAVLLGGSGKSYEYTIRTNSTNFNSPELSAKPVTHTQPSTKITFQSFAKREEDACVLEDGTPLLGEYHNLCIGQYMYNGGLVIQRLINDWIMVDSKAKEKGYFVEEHGVAFANFPSKDYIEQGFYAQINAFVPLIVIVGLIYPVTTSIRALVSEKENRSKELMKIMSITESSIGRAWFISLYGFLFLSGIFSTVVSHFLYPLARPMILFVFWQIAYLSITMFIFVIAAVSTKTTRSTLMGVLLFLVGYFLTLVTSYDEGTSNIISLVSLHPVTAMSYGIQVIGSLEDKGVGVIGETINATDNPSGYTFSNCMSSLFFDTILWGVISWYLNRVLKGDFGTPLPWYFPCIKAYWCQNPVPIKEDELCEENYESIPWEPVSEALKGQEKEGKAVLIRRLTKMFSSEKLAVDNLDLSMYSGQIFALLGHNGAGKTTTINMLTGMVTPSSGYSSVAGKDVVTQMALVRKHVGVCLQHDCLFPELTVKEHLQFFARVKGLYEPKSFQEAEASVEVSMQDVALLEKQHTYSKDLSGGMKRKLSVAIAFCGDSSVVFLDEPTSGMDPFSRRFTWNVIRQYKENRCIILTTHFMEEADLLGDRIGIMSEGQLRCVGSPLFLKKSYGVGYQLTIIKEQSYKENDHTLDDELKTIVIGNVQGSTVLTNVGTEMSFQLPIGASDTFPKMFYALDAKEQSQKIKTYGVSITTLESVFLMVARGETTKSSEREAPIVSSNVLKNVEEIDEEDHVRHDDTNDNTKTQPCNKNDYQQDLTEHQFFLRHMRSLLAKRAMNFKRDKKAWICSTILPVVFALIGFVLIAFIAPERNMGPLELKLVDYNHGVVDVSQNPIPFNNASTFTCQPGKCIYNASSFLNWFHNNSRSNITDYSSYNHYCGDYGQLNQTAQCSISENVEISNHFRGRPIGQNVTTILDASRALHDNPKTFDLKASQYGALYLTHDSSSVIVTGDEDYNGLEFAQAVTLECEEKRTDVTSSFGSSSAASCSKVLGEGGMGYVVDTNFTALHASLLYQAIADESIIRVALDDDDYEVKATIHPLPITRLESTFAQAQDSYAAWFLLVLSFPLIIGSFATFVVQERLSKAKHLQIVAGVKPEAYWLSTYIWDIVNYQIPVWTVIILMFAFDVGSFITSSRDAVGGTVVIFLLFGPSAAGFTYCVSFLFKSPSKCSTFVIVFNFFIGMVGPIVTLVFRIVAVANDTSSDGGTDFKKIAQIIEWVLRIFPSFNFSKALFYIINVDLFAQIYGNEDMTVWDVDVILLEVIAMFIQSIVYVWLAITIDKLCVKPKVVKLWKSLVTCRCLCPSFSKNKCDTHLIPFMDDEDEDVIRENERVHSGEANDDVIVLKDLTKRFSNGKLAVDHMSLGIPPGQCFGLLGINGAGKTTTMSMLTAEFPPTKGDATLAGYSVMNEPEQTRRRIGYCPQFDAHFTNMTGREHVELYASIKGMPEKWRKDSVTSMLTLVGLNNEDSDRLSSGYSGGMKRKLSVACAMIGHPQMVFLDEPSTGMDPVARRDLWGVISRMVIGNNSPRSDRTSVILTTHSMEECEALCPRIGIMTGGKFRCIGSAQHLKSRFGKGYQIELKISDVSEEDGDYKEIIVDFFQDRVAGPFVTSDVEKGIITDTICLNLSQVKRTLDFVSSTSGQDQYLSSKINEHDPLGYTVFKNASSDTGVSLRDVAAFGAKEMRVKKVLQFLEDTYPGSILRERQESKLRFEVSSEGMKISSLFSDFEKHKGMLQLADYGISQTSLEQVFNMHAAKAEKIKEGTTD